MEEAGLQWKDLCTVHHAEGNKNAYHDADTHEAYFLNIGFTINVLKPTAQEKLKKLPVPVEIRGGIKDGFALIDWFTTDNPQPRKKTAELITDFLGALVEALNSQ